MILVLLLYIIRRARQELDRAVHELQQDADAVDPDCHMYAMEKGAMFPDPDGRRMSPSKYYVECDQKIVVR